MRQDGARSGDARVELERWRGDGGPEPWAEGPGVVASVLLHWPVVVLAILLFGGGSYFLGLQQEPTYEATARLFLTDARSQALLREGNRFVVEPDRYVPQQAERVTSRPVLRRADELLGEQLGVSTLEDRVDAEGDPALEVITVTATDRTPESAALIADAVARAYQEVTRESTLEDATAAVDQLADARAQLRELIVQTEAQVEQAPGDAVLTGQLEAYNQQLLQLEVTAQQLAVDAALFGAGVDFFEPAEVPTSPTSPPPLLFGLLGALLGAVLASALAYRYAIRHDRVVSKTDPARILQAPLLGEIPKYDARKSGTLSDRLHLDPAVEETFQFLFSSVQYAMDDLGARSVVITSPRPGDGKTSTALHLAKAAAHGERRVLLVDGDIRMRGLTELLEAQAYPGLTEVVLQGEDVQAAVQRYEVGAGLVLDVVPAGAGMSDRSTFFRSRAYREGMRRLREAADMVIVDSPPVLPVADAVLAMGQVDGVVLVINRGTPVKELEELRQRFAFVATPVLGYVYNRADVDIRNPYGYERGSTPQASVLLAERATEDGPTGVIR